jgi:hypothetical protein
VVLLRKIKIGNKYYVGISLSYKGKIEITDIEKNALKTNRAEKEVNKIKKNIHKKINRRIQGDIKII